ncbi:MAG: metallophosphoesterase [Clostridia bacterium]|nr:metallophosphoesterase [Clostridia bacterium]
MWGAIRTVGVFVAIPIALYFFFFIKRAIGYFFPDLKKQISLSVSAVSAVAIGLTSTDIFGFPAVFVLHVIFFSLICRFVNFILKRIKNGAASRAKIWQFLYKSGALALAFTLAFSLYGYINLHNVVATEYKITTEKDIRAEGYRVILIADVHYGVSVDDEALARICDEIESLSPDMVLLCGDIVDNNTTTEEMKFMFSEFGSIKSEFGTFYVHGNHDKPFGFAGFESEFSEDLLTSTIKNSNITILTDDIVEIGNDILLVGRNDASERNRMPIDELLNEANCEKFILTLDHQPRDYENIAASKTDLVLSGHTHAGQIWPVGQIQELFNMNDEVYGHGFIDGDTQFIVTSGFAGWKYPIKTAEKAEYVIVEIKSE